MSSIFNDIRGDSQKRLSKLQQTIGEAYPSNEINDRICIYVCGSLARLEMTGNSDLDLFFIDSGNAPIPNLDKYLFFANLHSVSNSLGFQPPSKRGMYWDFIPKSNLLDIGSRQEDYNNSFTARMLLLLESKPLYNRPLYDKIVEETIAKYFAVYDDYRDEFLPLFLMNDILRYWYTLTLNYEYRKDDNDDTNKKNWKRLKLKYARLITCYSMLACLYKEKASPKYVTDCVSMTPFERIYMLAYGNNDAGKIVSKIETEYEWFLKLRDQRPEWWNTPANKTSAFNHADNFHDLVVHEFMGIISNSNPILRRKTDVY